MKEFGHRTNRKNRYLVVTLILMILAIQNLAFPKLGSTQNIVIKMATLAPNGSPWHEILKDMGAEWSKASGGVITLRIYPGGVAGDEADMVRKIRIGQLHAALMSNGGLSRIAPAVNVLVIPMVSDSWASLDRVRGALASRVETLLGEKGFVVLNWGDGGWVRFFVPRAEPVVETVQKAKLFVTAGDDRTIELWNAAGFNAVPLTPADILPALQTGMINAFNSTAVIALANQWFPFTPYMIDMPWAPLVGATIISKRAWLKIPEELHLPLKELAEKTGERLRSEIRRLEDEAIIEMQKRGLKVVKPTEEQIIHWRHVMKSAYPKIRGQIIPEDWFDDAIKAANKVKQSVIKR